MGIRAGDLVRVREATWRVAGVRAFPHVRVLRLVGADARNRWQPCTLLEPFDRVQPVPVARAPRLVSRARWMRTLAALVASATPAACPATVAEAQVTLMPHQIQPLLAILRGEASRLLLADAVGLGKTIQAALLLRELRARGAADRVLVLVPSGLRDQWQHELSHRTGLPSLIVDATSLAARTRELPPDINPWALPGLLIVSLDFLKQDHVLHGADRLPWDILVVDEAHNLNAGTDRYAAVETLARHSRVVVLLTATPHHGSDDAFDALCRVGCLDEETDPLAIFRRTRSMVRPSTSASSPSAAARSQSGRRDAGAIVEDDLPGVARIRRDMWPRRRVHVLRVAQSPAERWLHTLLARYRHRVERDALPGDAPALALSVLTKRACSSASSLERSLRRRLAMLEAAQQPEAEAAETLDDSRLSRRRPPQARLPFEGSHNRDDFGADSSGAGDADEDPADREPVHALSAPGLRSARVERAWLTLLIEAARNAARDERKPLVLARWLGRVREPALIYTEYRDTLAHLARTLPRDVSCALLHGGLGADARRTALSRFAAGDARVLLTTDAAGEGLNLQHRCRLVVNVELPWNPNRLEQRIGRVDRLGQTRTVHAVHLVAAGTAEEPMLDRLTNRVQQIAAALGDAPAVLNASAPRVADVVADDAPLAPTPNDTRRAVPAGAPQAQAIVSQLHRIRALRTRASDAHVSLDRRAPLIAIARRHVREHLDVGGNDERQQRSAAHQFGCDAPGLLCIWRTRLPQVGGHAPPLITPIHVACKVPRQGDRRMLLSFVMATLDRCRDDSAAVLDRELECAQQRFAEAERPWRERMARRDEAIASVLRAQAQTQARIQPLLFDDIALEQARASTGARTGAVTIIPFRVGGIRENQTRSDTARLHLERPASPELSDANDARAGADDGQDHDNDLAAERSLVLVLVLR